VGIFVGEGAVGVETPGGLVTALVGLRVGGDGDNGGDGDGGDGDGVVLSPPPPPAGVGAAVAVMSTQNGHKSCSVCEKDRRLAYDTGASKYDSEIDWDEWMMGISKLRKTLLSNATGRVLEVAAGTGRNLEYYPANVKHVVATDCSTAMLEVAEKKARALRAEDSQPCEHTFVPLDVDAMPGHLKVCSFDTVVDTFGLCSYENPVESLVKMAAMCKPDGKILLLEHGQGTWGFVNRILDSSAEKHAQKWGWPTLAHVPACHEPHSTLLSPCACLP